MEKISIFDLLYFTYGNKTNGFAVLLDQIKVVSFRGHLFNKAFIAIHQIQHVIDLLLANNGRVMLVPDTMGQFSYYWHMAGIGFYQLYRLVRHGLVYLYVATKILNNVNIENRRAKFDYQFIEKLVAGMVLTGTE